MLSKYMVEKLALFTQEEFYIFIGLATGFFISLAANCLVDAIFLRSSEKRLKVLERIILDKSKVVMNIDDFEAYCSSKFARPDNLEGYFKFTPEGDVMNVSDIDVKED